jgi:molecular chaperone GrpE
MSHDTPRPGAPPVSPEADTDSETTRTVSESGPASEPGSPERHHPPTAEQHEPEKASPAAEAEAADHEAQLEHDLEELAAKAERADEYLELAQRTKADFENYRKRAARETAAAQERGVVKLAQELLPAIDNLDRALAASDGSGDAETLVSGLKLVHAGVVAALARLGIEPYSPLGEQFDPQYHEAVAQQPVEGTQAGTIVEVYQRGYRLGDSVLRPARVVVAA